MVRNKLKALDVKLLTLYLQDEPLLHENATVIMFENDTKYM